MGSRSEQRPEPKGRFRINRLEDRIAPSLVGSLLPCLSSLTGALQGNGGCHPCGDSGDHSSGCDSSGGAGNSGGHTSGSDCGHTSGDTGSGGGGACDSGGPELHVGVNLDVNVCTSASVGGSCGGADVQSHEDLSAHVNLGI
jgi:hypothetical protein